MGDRVKLICGSSHPAFAQIIADHLCMPLGRAEVGKFSNGETSVTITESIRGTDLYIIQSVCGPALNDALMELLIMIDAARRASPTRIAAVIPYFGYARQNSKERSRSPIACKLVANLLMRAGVDRIITMDLAASQVQGFFDIPVDNLYAETQIVKYIERKIDGMSGAGARVNGVVVSPSVEGVKRAKIIADKLECDLAILHEGVQASKEGPSMVLVGEVKDKIALVIGDIADTCHTLELAAETLMARGASKVYGLVSHAVLSANAVERVKNSQLTELVVTNSIPLGEEARACPRIHALNVAPMMADAIRRIHYGESMTSSSKFTII
eukprot:TRINITY_DN5882_c0_g1_i4.p1 TRINITY_DN5882_c0_g1~~TRINITY_DN5882_c0_g1_i4.p1  ORF type:complete len:327 (+),score=43.21 TRINITY_DN5882_c0_g1_i4:100-1080(+)